MIEIEGDVDKKETSNTIPKVVLDFKGSILIADDQLINIEALKIRFQELNLENNCEYYFNG